MLLPSTCAGRRDAAEVAERRVDAHEIDGALADAAGLRHAGHDPDERGAGGLLPQGELPPVVLLAQVPAVVAPEHDDGVVLVGGLVEGVEQAADVHVGVGDRGEVGLHGFLPAAGLEHRLVVALGPGHLHAGRRNVVQVVLAIGRQLDLVERDTCRSTSAARSRACAACAGRRRGRTACRASCRAARCRSRRSCSRAGPRPRSRAGRT